MKRASKLWAVFDGTRDFFALLTGVILASLMLLVVAAVIMRYFFGRSIIWETEVSEYGLLFITFLGAAWLLKEEGHVVLDVLLARLSPRPKALTNALTSVVGALACLLVAWYGIEVTLKFYHLKVLQPTIIKPPSFIFYSFIPTGFFLLFVQFLRRAYKNLEIWRVPTEHG
ncbi:MAG: TRAP transporter small permease [Chloroflexi bacterium]|nr:TRAP transporter small permease [Chloroflexota bacterium]